MCSSDLNGGESSGDDGAMGMGELFPTAVKKYIPRVRFILAVLHEAAIQDNIWPSTCRAEIATVADHAAH